jgi:hypothetical protein
MMFCCVASKTSLLALSHWSNSSSWMHIGPYRKPRRHIGTKSSTFILLDWLTVPQQVRIISYINSRNSDSCFKLFPLFLNVHAAFVVNDLISIIPPGKVFCTTSWVTLHLSATQAIKLGGNSQVGLVVVLSTFDICGCCSFLDQETLSN